MIWKQRIKKFHLKVESQGRDDSGGQVKPFLQVGVSTRRLLPEKKQFTKFGQNKKKGL